MKIEQASSFRAAKLQALLNAAQAGQLRVGPEFHNVKAKPNALLVDAVNADPFVFVPPATVHTFESKRGSGTDHLRQRMLAGVFFEGLH